MDSPELFTHVYTAGQGCIPEGGLCVGIAGPVGRCCPGLVCRSLAPDLSLCEHR
ncbi:hypothetical protein [Nonomuraea sp. NPDC049158]|uniref:hypothetical protein n=1 Tax=Nonomuraea sp. NPDC049158 TaxID=3155649 RepID=UPI00340780EC